MKPLSIISCLAISAAAFIGGSLFVDNAQAQSSYKPAASAAIAPLAVAELFTSQSCSSCPPAEALFAKLADREDVLTLEWHVDYWDTLIHGGSRWKDVYSHADYTARQRAYNRSLRGTSAVYTPQAIINGTLEGVGSRRAEVSDMLSQAENLAVAVSIENNVATIGASQKPVEVLFVRLLERHETDVKGGENKGRKLHGKHIVLEAEVLGKTGNTSATFTLPKVGTGETCAVLVQSLAKNVGPVLGAAKC